MEKSSLVREALHSPGQPLDRATRSALEPRFGHDFSRVRIHHDSPSADALGAHACTVGSDVVFGAGKYAPRTDEGRRLLAHELTHVTQQRGVVARSAATLDIGPADDVYEREADRTAAAVTSGRSAAPPTTAAPRLQGFWSELREVLLFPLRMLGLSAFYSREDLVEYLGGIRRNNRIEDGLTSDNKARACVDREQELGGFDTNTKTLLVREMLAGYTSIWDENAIIALLRRAAAAERLQIVTTIGRSEIWSNFTYGNRRVIEAVTLTAADVTDAWVGQMRTRDSADIQDYIDNAKDPAVRAGAQRALAMNRTTAPVPNNATLTPTGELTFTTRNGMTVLVAQDAPASENQASSGGTGCRLEGNNDGEMSSDASGAVTVTRQPTYTLRISTTYQRGSDPSGPSGYGRGATATDRAAGNTSLRFHESNHGQDCIDYVQSAPPPPPPQHAVSSQALRDQWSASIDNYNIQMLAFSIQRTDCVEPAATDAQLEQFHIPPRFRCHPPSH
jgi:hypothetical protein